MQEGIREFRVEGIGEEEGEVTSDCKHVEKDGGVGLRFLSWDR